jgi:hypothetical protein
LNSASLGVICAPPFLGRGTMSALKAKMAMTVAAAEAGADALSRALI